MLCIHTRPVPAMFIANKSEIKINLVGKYSYNPMQIAYGIDENSYFTQG